MNEFWKNNIWKISLGIIILLGSLLGGIFIRETIETHETDIKIERTETVKAETSRDEWKIKAEKFKTELKERRKITRRTPILINGEI